MTEIGESGSGKVTNLDYLRRLSKGNNDFVRDMIKIFLEENPAEIKTLENAVNQRDFQRINAAAHKLRSTVPFVGIDKLISGDIAELEKLALDQSEETPLGEVRLEKKSGLLPTDKELIAKIDRLFSRIKSICFKSYEELSALR